MIKPAVVMFREIRYIIFDLDGTLIDSSMGVIEATNYALKKLGEKPRPEEEIKPFIGFPLEDMFGSFCDAPINELKKAFQDKAREAMVASTRALPDSEEVLSAFHKAGYVLGVATTKYKIHSRGIIDKFGWEKYFSAVASGDEVARVKPAPDLVQLALKKLGAEKGSAVMVGDTVNDIMAARAAGIKTISIISPFDNEDLAGYHPDMLLNNIAEIKSVFGV